MSKIARALTFAFCLGLGFAYAAHAAPPNLLILTVDDMSCDSIGAFGCKLPGTSPNVDRLAAEGLRFEFAHVQVGNCMPSRNVMFSGRYSHNNRVEGFYQVRDPGYPVLADLMKKAGYFTAIRGKVAHSTPYSPYAWDLVLDTLPDGKRAGVKNIASYRTSTEQGLRAAKAAGKPFCLIMNVSDPHKPFYAEGKGGQTVPDVNVPSKVFTPEEVPVPGFLFVDPVVRKELAHYYSSVRRADDCAGVVLEALAASGEADRTLVLFLSDHGMPLPFAKTQLYHHSTRTPLIVRWPGVTTAGTWDRRHMVSAVDFMPTVLDAVGIAHPEGLDGRSFLPLLKGEAQADRDMVVKEYNENSGGHRNPMRAVETRNALYLFNAWSVGGRKMATATAGTPTYRRMKQLAETDPAIAARLELFDHRVVEEFYDVREDPDCRVNLIADTGRRAEIDRFRAALESWMERTGDPLLDVFRHRDDPAALAAFMTRIEAEAAARDRTRERVSDSEVAASEPQPSAPRTKAQAKAKMKAQAKAQAKANRSDDLFVLEVPESITPGAPVVVKIRHQVPGRLGTQQLHVTLKGGTDRARLDRKVVEVAATGVAEVRFEVPTQVSGNVVSFAAFLGEDYPTSLQHVQSADVPVR
jgi:N-sulfoglucosamine sulfohydrolase